MCLFEPFAEFDSVFQDLFDGQGTLTQTIRQGLALQVFHYQVIDPILVANIVESADVGMVQGRNRACFAVEALFSLGIVRKMRRENFYGDGAVESSVPGAIALTHTAGA